MYNLNDLYMHFVQQEYYPSKGREDKISIYMLILSLQNNYLPKPIEHICMCVYKDE